MTTTVLPITSISVPANRQRKVFPEQEMEELKESILTEKGLMSPILVRPGKEEGHYYLVAGERRFRVISTIEVEYNFGNSKIPSGSIPVVVRNFSSDMAATEAELHENMVRLNLTWQEQAAAIAALHELKVMQNPAQKLSQTALEIDDSEHAKNSGYATANMVRKVEHSVLVAQYMHDPDVAKASTLKDATKIVTRKLEEDLLERMHKHREAKQLVRASEQSSAQQQIEAAEQSSEISSLLQSLAAPPLVTGLLEGSFTFLAGDVREKLLEIEDSSVNIIITDPPYGEGVEDFNEGAAPQPHRYTEDDYEELHELLTDQMSRICTKSAHVYIFCNSDYFPKLRDMVASKGWNTRRTPLIWYKKRGALADGLPVGYRRTYECILFAQRGSRPCSATVDDVITVTSVAKKVHAAQKPVELYQRLLDMSSVPGDCILDAFAGSGTLFHAIRDRPLKGIAIEKDPMFIEICRQAIEGIIPDMTPEL